MNSKGDFKQNVRIWQQLYADGRGDLQYPSDVFVRLCHRLLDPKTSRRVLDYGFGTGANLLHLARLGFSMTGVEVSAHALAKTADRLAKQDLHADLRLIEAGTSLPFADETFDVVVSWQVLYYNDWTSLRCAVAELNRVLRQGGLFVCSTCAPGDVSMTLSDDLGGGLYRSRAPGQEGCIIVVLNEAQLGEIFAGQTVDVGEFYHRMSDRISRHWVVTYRKQ